MYGGVHNPNWCVNVCLTTCFYSANVRVIFGVFLNFTLQLGFSYRLYSVRVYLLSIVVQNSCFPGRRNSWFINTFVFKS